MPRNISISKAFEAAFGRAPEAIGFAPGRVEVLGNHTDYNGGLVLSVALELGVTVAAARHPSDPEALELRSEAAGETRRFRIDDEAPERGAWTSYIRGVLREIRRRGTALRGLQVLVDSSLPMGAGVSSSAALELATAEAVFDLLGGRPGDLMEEAQLCQRAEVEFVGVPCGLLDQFSSAFGRKDHALFLDASTLDHRRIPLGRSDLSIVLADTLEKHALVDGKYAALRASCERAARSLGTALGRRVEKLRSVTLEEFLEHRDAVDPEDRPRAEHVIRENDRVLRGALALEAGEHAELRRLMLESHASSRDLLGNSTPALDLLVEVASRLPGFQGGKLTGGGFGGSTVNLVETGRVEAFSAELERAFIEKLGRPPALIRSRVGDGARVIRSSRERRAP